MSLNVIVGVLLLCINALWAYALLYMHQAFIGWHFGFRDRVMVMLMSLCILGVNVIVLIMMLNPWEV